MPHSNVTNIPCPVEASQLRRRRALADAIAGVVATLVSLWTFYPIDVLKTKLQAGIVDTTGKTSSLFSGLFRGLPLKTLHAASSSFTYFYLYSFIVSWWNHHHHGAKKKKMSPAVRLSLSAIAAMMNTLLTLPLDVLASKKQAAPAKDDENNNNKFAYSNENSTVVDETQEESESSSEEEEGANNNGMQGLTLRQQQQLKMDHVWQNLQILRPQQAQEEEAGQDGDVFYDSCSEEQPVTSRGASFDSQDSNVEEEKDEEEGRFQQGHLTVTVTTNTSSSLAANNNNKNKKKLLHFEPGNLSAKVAKFSPREEVPPQPSLTATDLLLSRIPSLWKGLFPSLLLCSNPSIHYTVFDMAKSHLLQTKAATANANLTMSEAFVLGLFAKFCATIATYPLIRAKVMLMVTSRKSMLKTLMENYQRDGIAHGWYKGCSVQLLHTVLKSALLMMVKERIARTTHQLLVPPPSSSSLGAQSAAARS